MLESLTWSTALKSSEAQAQLAELRRDAFRLFLNLATVGYLLWHIAYTALWSQSDALFRAYAIFVVAVPILVAAHVLFATNQRAAITVFLGGALVAIVWAVYILESARGVILCVMLVLVAAFVVHPIGGILVAGMATAGLLLLGVAKPGLVGPGDAWYVLIFSGLTIVGVWALKRHLFLALNWYEDSFFRAEEHAREAQQHRAQLLDAWKQLDTAYYRVERANAALQAAWKAADEAERSKMEVVTNISHELRTPLNLIVGFSEMMMTSPGSYDGAVLPLPFRLDLNAIYRSAQHLLALTDDVLDLARLEVGHLGLLREPVDLGQVTRDAVSLVQDYVEAKGLELRVEIAENLPPVMVDRLRIRQVLLNLLTNAARVTERGWVGVEIRRHERQLRVSVVDTGPGINPPDQPRIFERFVTHNQSAADHRRGSGLGLPISRTFVELHGGEMGVESTAGSGTTFWFTLPLDPVDRVEAGAGTATLTAGRLRQQERVLVLADPDPTLGRLLGRHLDGYRIEVAAGLADAEVLALQLKAAAIITDLGTPDERGANLVPIVRCPLPRPGRLALDGEVADYLVKPVSREGLLAAIEKLGGPVRRILVADDDAWFCQLLTRMLTTDDHRYVVSTAHSGEEALTRMRQNPPDVLLLDLAMPGLSGIGTLQEMASVPALQKIKVLVISAHAENMGSAPLGGEVLIRKPEGFHLAELTRLIAATVSQLTPVQVYVNNAEPVPPAGQTG